MSSASCTLYIIKCIPLRASELARVRKILDEKVSVMEKMLADLEPTEDKSLLAGQLLSEEEDRGQLPPPGGEADLVGPIGKTVMDQVSSSLQLADDEGLLAPSLATFPLVLQLSDLDCPKFCINIQVVCCVSLEYF